jgi:hypothetical protein
MNVVFKKERSTYGLCGSRDDAPEDPVLVNSLDSCSSGVF